MIQFEIPNYHLVLELTRVTCKNYHDIFTVFNIKFNQWQNYRSQLWLKGPFVLSSEFLVCIRSRQRLKRHFFFQDCNPRSTRLVNVVNGVCGVVCNINKYQCLYVNFQCSVDPVHVSVNTIHSWATGPDLFWIDLKLTKGSDFFFWPF